MMFRKSFFQWFFSVIFIGLLLSSCTTTKPSEPFQTRLYVGTFDDVWLATLKAINDYPLKVSNKDSGKIQTEVVNGPYNELVFIYPESIDQPERYRYSIRFNFAKLMSEGRQPLVRVRVIKDLEQFQDFYTGWLAYPSDGLEERILLYRIQHILGMEQTLVKSEEKAREEQEKKDSSKEKPRNKGSFGDSSEPKPSEKYPSP